MTHETRRSFVSIVVRATFCFAALLALTTPLTALQDGFAVFGDEGVWLQINSRVVDGDVGVNNSSDGPFLIGDVELMVGPGVRINAEDSLVISNRIALDIGSRVRDVHANEVSGIGLVQGSFTTPLTTPVVTKLPDVPVVVPGRVDVDVPLFSAATLDAGQYGELDVGVGATLTLTGGLYDFASCTVGNSARLLFDGPTEVRIAGRLLVDHLAHVEPAPAARTLTAEEILIVAAGINGTSGALDELPHAASFGQGTSTRARVYAPNGTLEVQQNGQVVGALLGRWVIFGPGCIAEFEGGFGMHVLAAGGVLSTTTGKR